VDLPSTGLAEVLARGTSEFERARRRNKSARASRAQTVKRMIGRMEKECKDEEKKVVVPPVDVGLPPSVDSVAIPLDGQPLARRKHYRATLLRSTQNASFNRFAFSLLA
jgi:hypothetical protein